MCEVMERYEQKAAEKAYVEVIKFMISSLDASKEAIGKKHSEKEYDIALKELESEKIIETKAPTGSCPPGLSFRLRPKFVRFAQP